MNLESYCDLLAKEDFLAKEDIVLVLKRCATSLKVVEKKMDDLVKGSSANDRGIASNLLDIERRLVSVEEKLFGQKRGLSFFPGTPEPVKKAKKEEYWAIKKPAPLLDKWEVINGEIQHFVRTSPDKGWVIDLECKCQYCTKTH